MVKGSPTPFGSNGTKSVSEIAELRIYPIKSCRGLVVSDTKLTHQGLDLDRQWMFVKVNTDKDEPRPDVHQFITIRDLSKMTLIDTAISPDGGDLVISIRHTDKRVSVPLKATTEWLEANTKLTTVNVWDYYTDAYEYGDDINSIFCEFFDQQVWLVHKGPTPRIAGGNGAKMFLGREESVNFPDVLPVQIASQASLQELNSRLNEKGEDSLTIERFRPNIIVKGDIPWSEDSWKTVRINGATSLVENLRGGYFKALDLDVAARCLRCQVPNVHPDTAEKHRKEPWDTLMSYRRIDEGMAFKPSFGMLCCPRNEGEVKVGMRFEVLETTEHHKYQKGF